MLRPPAQLGQLQFLQRFLSQKLNPIFFNSMSIMTVREEVKHMGTIESVTVDRVEHFRIRDLPRELRDRIYGFAIEPRAEFRLMGRKHMEPSLSLPTMSLRKEKDSTSSVGLVFELNTSTPLLLVSKSVRTEVQELMRRLRPIWHAIVESAGNTNRVDSPCRVFQEICSRSRFTLDVSPDSVYWFLDNIPGSLKSNIRDIVITRACLSAGRRSIDAWDPYDKRCAFMNCVQARCDSLQTVALEVPSVISGSQFTVQSATRILLQLLSDKVLTSVCFVQRTISENLHDRFIFEVLTGLADSSDAKVELQQPEESSKTYAISRDFDVSEESGVSLREWATIGFKRALRVS